MRTNSCHKGLRRQPPAFSQRWLTTFNDMITLLMVFFVLLFSMGSMDVKRFKNFQNALQSAMGVLYEGQHAPVGLIAPQDALDLESSAQGQTDAHKQGRLDELTTTPGLEAEYTPRGIQLILDDNLLFASGKADLMPSGLSLLNKVARTIRPMRRYVRVEGHTDNVPISNRRYPSNWELSTARAIQVVKYLADRGGIEPRYLSAAAYGEARPRVPNDSIANQSKNRRVEIILGQVAASRNDVLENTEEWRN